MARPEVIVGQIWQDTDKRRCERFVAVLETIAPSGSPVPIDARIQSCDDNGTILLDCPRMFISINRLRTRFRLHDNTAKPAAAPQLEDAGAQPEPR